MSGAWFRYLLFLPFLLFLQFVLLLLAPARGIRVSECTMRAYVVESGNMNGRNRADRGAVGPPPEGATTEQSDER